MPQGAMAGPDALAAYFKNSRSRSTANPRLTEDISVMRAVSDGSHILAAEPLEVIYADEPALTLAGPSLWCIPLGARTSPNVILYFHGGGFITNSIMSHRKMAAHFGKAANMQVLMIDYRMVYPSIQQTLLWSQKTKYNILDFVDTDQDMFAAPEYKFPAYLDDALEAYRFLLKKGYKPENIVSMGDSAGGNLSTALPLKLRDLGEPMPRVIVPISPWYDMECVDGTIDSNVETDALIGREAILGLVGMIYANEDAKSPLVQVLNADPKGLPPMYIVVGGYETLRDNGEKFYKKAVDAGVEAVLEVGEGQQHVYTFMAGKDKNADRTIANVGKWLREKFA